MRPRPLGDWEPGVRLKKKADDATNQDAQGLFRSYHTVAQTKKRRSLANCRAQRAHAKPMVEEYFIGGKF